MKTSALPTTIHVHQAYEVWSSEPEIIRFLDVRENAKFQAQRVPGSIWIAELSEVASRARDLSEVLFVIVSEGSANPIGDVSLGVGPEMENIVSLQGGIEAWLEAGFPTCPQDRKQLSARFEKESTMNRDPIFYQLFEPQTSTYTYLLADADTKEAVLIDPVLESVDRDLQLIQEHGLRLLYVLDTHIHADHVTGAGEIRKRTGAKTAVSRLANVECVDVPLEDGQEIRFGKHSIRVLETPGHTDSCLSFYSEGRVFTGDALLIRGTGRTDFQQGSAEKLYDSIHEKLYLLPPETDVYPGHDYRGQTRSTLAMEMKFNPRISQSTSKEKFITTMKELKLAQPKKIHEAVPANLACGRPRDERVFHPQEVNGVPEISPQDLKAHLKEVTIIDVRRPDEYHGELGHVPGSKLVTLGYDLKEFLEKMNREQEIVFVCRSGGRSGQATAESRGMGFKKTINMRGGMLLWNELGLPVERS